jgi:hypothetical protein
MNEFSETYLAHVKTKAWHAVTQAEGDFPHFWLYLIETGDDPWRSGAQRWDVYKPFSSTDRIMRGIWTPVSDRFHRFEARQPIGDTDLLEIRLVDSFWIEHEAKDFSPEGYAPHERIPQDLSVELIVGYLDDAYGKGIAWQERNTLRRRELSRHLSQPMIEAFIRECAYACSSQPTREILTSEPEGAILNPPWRVAYTVKEQDGEHALAVLISNRFTNDHAFTIGQDGGVTWK